MNPIPSKFSFSVDIQFQISSDLISAQVQDSFIILSLINNHYYSFNDIGISIWQKLKFPVSLSDLCNFVCKMYFISPEQARTDIHSFLAHLENEELIFRC